MLNVTTVGGHKESNTWWSSPPPCWRVLVAALPRWSAERLSTQQSSQASAGFTLPAWRLDVVVQPVQIWRVSMNPQVRLQQVLDDARNAEKLGLFSYRQHNFVIFICILTKLCGKVYVHTSSVKISCKNRHALLKRQQESGGFLFSGRQLCIVQAISSNL